MTSRNQRLISAGTWIVVQDVLVKLGAAFGVLGLVLQLLAIATGGPVSAIGGIMVIAVVLPFLISWSLEPIRMNGLPYEQQVVNWLSNQR